ncbi:MAG: sigma-70 family RNA polymerase sigma factor [Chitinophagaceae bacterium]|nr:sigma-70 family RNA polymerase sigma factor [Chitinophagaceae bacterium]
MGKKFAISISSDLLLSVSRGDKVAFARLHGDCERFVRSVIKRYIPDDDDCNELTQEIFISLWERRESLTDIRNFNDYLFIVTRNRVFKYFTHLRKEAMIIKELQQRNTFDVATVLTTDLREYHRIWAQAVELLPAQQKQVYTMIEQGEERLDDVAGELGLARGTVKKHLELARRSVRKFIAAQLENGRFIKVVAPLAIIPLFIS